MLLQCFQYFVTRTHFGDIPNIFGDLFCLSTNKAKNKLIQVFENLGKIFRILPLKLIYIYSLWNMIFTLYSNDFLDKRKIYNFDKYIGLKPFVVQGREM